MKIIRKTNQEKGFYSILGPFLARREVEREIGYKIYDDDGKEWLIATENESILGFCYLWKKSKEHYQVGSCYVVEQHRQKGVFRKLLVTATKDIEGTVTLTTKNNVMKQILLKEGFDAKKERGGFVEYAKEFQKPGL